MPENLALFLQREFVLEPEDTYRVSGPVNLARLMQLCDLVVRPDLSFPAFRPSIPAPFDQTSEDPADLFRATDERDHLLHHPYQSFHHVIAFLTAAAYDPD